MPQNQGFNSSSFANAVNPQQPQNQSQFQAPNQFQNQFQNQNQNQFQAPNQNQFQTPNQFQNQGFSPNQNQQQGFNIQQGSPQQYNSNYNQRGYVSDLINFPEDQGEEDIDSQIAAVRQARKEPMSMMWLKSF